MAKDYAGATPLDTALNRLGVAPTKPVSVKDSIDSIARKTQVPANVLLALDDGSGDTSKAERNAQFLSRAVQGGTKIEDAVKALAGDDEAGQAVLNRSYEIADQFYTSATPQQNPGEGGSSLLADLGKQTAGSAVRGAGSAVRGAGAMIDAAAQEYRGTADDPGESIVRSGARAAGGAVEGVGESISDTVSDERKKALEGSQPSGSLLDPSSISLGDDPSLEGYAMLAAEGLGSMVPVVVAAMAGGPGAAGAVGGAMGGGEGASNARKFVEDAAKTIGEDGRPEIAKLPEYQKLIEDGRSPEDAAEILAQRAEGDAAFAQSIPAALGGVATSKIISKADGWLGRGGRLSRVAKKAGASALEEGTQEAIEGASGKAGIEAATAADLDLAEDTFGDFVAGGLAGGGMGAIAGAVGPGEAPQGLPVATDGPNGPLMLPPPSPGPGGPVVSAPRQITSDPSVQNPNYAFPGLPAPQGDVPPAPETGVVPAPRQIGFNPNVQNPNWNFPSGSPDPGADGSGTGPVAAPGGSLPLSGGDPGAAATNLGDPVGLLTPPSGPVESLAQTMPAPATEEPAPPPQRFPEHNPGSTVRLFDPNAGQAVDGVFLGETENGALVRIGGQEVEIDPEQFDSARDAAKVADEVAKEQAKEPKKPENAGTVDPETPSPAQGPSGVRLDDGRGPSGEGTPSQEDSVSEGAGDVPDMTGQPDTEPAGEAGQGDSGGGALAGDAGQSDVQLTDSGDLDALSDSITDEEAGPSGESEITNPEDTHRAAFMAAAKRRETAYDAFEAVGSPATGPVKDEFDAAIKNLRGVRAASIRDLGKEKTEELFSAADDATVKQPETEAQQGSVAEAAKETEPEPTEGQKEAGNYRKGHARWNGLDLSIENQKGSQRRGTDPNGNEWSVTMPANYGYFRRTEGADGDHVDFYMGDNEASPNVYVIDQKDAETGAFDEHKVMLGFDSPQDARKTHTAAFSDGKGLERFGGIRKMSVPGFKEWLAKGDTKTPATDAMRRKLAAGGGADQNTAPGSTPEASGGDAFEGVGMVRGKSAGEFTAVQSQPVGASHTYKIQPITSGKPFEDGKRWMATAFKTDRNGRKTPITKGPSLFETEEQAVSALRDMGMRTGVVDESGNSQPGERKPIEQAPNPEDSSASETEETSSGSLESAPETSDEVSTPKQPASLDPKLDEVATETTSQANPEVPELKPADATGKIEDFGEKLEGARKDVWANYADRMRDAEDIDVSAEPLSKSWPAPDYQKLIEAGVDPWTISFIRVVRDAVPTKPQKSWRLKGWAQNVEVLRDLANRLMRGDIDRADIESGIGEIDAGKTNIKRSIELYEAVGHGKSLKGLRFGAANYSMLDGRRHDPPLTRWEVTSAAKATAFSNMPRIIAHGDTKEAALTAFKKAHASLDQKQEKAKKGAKFIIYSRRTGNDERSYHVGVKIGRNHIDLREVPDVKEARRLIAEESDALQAQLDKMRDIPNERRDSNSPRVGVDHRSGADVTPEQFSETFGFRGVQFGNWVEGGRRQQDLNEAYDALMDLAGILDLPPRALSLNGSLGLAFGARGSGGRNAAAAHYEPNQVVINLTKKQGRGSLAHEWFHAADNYFSRKRDRKDGYITDNTAPGGQVEGLRSELVDALGEVRRAISRTDLKKRSANIDKMRSSPYWSTGIEMHARAFESYVIAKLQDQNASNDYLANVVNGAAWGMQAELSGLGDSYPYLKPGEIETVRPAFDDLFATIQTRDTEQGVEMFSRFADREPVAELTGNELGPWKDMRQLGRKAEAWYRENLLGKTVTNEETGWGITFTAAGGRKVGGRKGDVLMRIVPALNEIISKGSVVSSTPDRRGRSNVVAVHAMAARVNLEGQPRDVVATIVETTDGKFHYDLSRDNRDGARFSRTSITGDVPRYGLEDSPASESDGAADQVTEARSGTVELNLDLADGKIKVPRAAAALAINDAVTDELRKVGLLDKVIVEVGGDGNGAAGSYRAGVIRIFRDAGGNWRETLNHEIIHALRDPAQWGNAQGLFTREEWQALVRAARADKAIHDRVRATYSDLSTSAQFEEMVAELYAEWARDRGGFGPLRRAFEKMRQFFRAVARGLRRTNNPDAAEIMERIARGEIGNRGPDGPGGGSSSTTKERRVELADALGAAGSRAKGMLGNLHWKKTPALFSNWMTDAMGKSDRLNSLALVPGRPLFTELGKGLSSAQSYLHEKEAMDAERNDWHGRGDTVAKQWWKLRVKDSEANNRLMDLMHKSTLSDLDPSKPDDWVHPQKARADALVRMGTQKARATAQIIYDEIEAREKAYTRLKADYDALPPDFQNLYRTVRYEYSALADATDAALIENVKIATEIGLKRAQRTHRKEMQRIKDEGLTGTERDQAVLEADAALDAAERRAKAGSAARMAGMRQQFESNRMSGPYFPLARFGTYFVTIRDNQGKVTSFSRFEKKAQQDAFIRDAEQRGLGKIEHGVLNADTNLRDMVDPRFVAEIEDLLTDAGADFEVMDAIWQHWLETLPDQSVRTNQIHRKGRAGFTPDAFRAFGKQMFHGAHQLARLKHGLKMEEMLNTAEEEAARSDNPERMGFVVQEMRRRHAFAMNPTGNPIVSSATSLGFAWYLGMSPAAALVNISQTTLIGTPIMAHRFKKAGITGSVAAVTRAMRDFADGRGWSEKSGRLTDEEKSAMQAAYKLGTIDKTQAHDLASVADSGVEYSPVRQSVMEKIGWMFHHAERLNREVTFLANYRLSRREGISHDQAIREASDLTWKIHFDYQNSSRPRFMQGDVAKVIFLFRSYTVNTLWRMFRDSHQTFHGASKEERAEARAQLTGITLSMMAHAGIKGVWGYGLLMGLLGLFLPGGDDDAEQWLEDALLLEGDDMGSAAWNYIMGMALNGAPGQVAGIDLTNRIGMPNLWFRDSGRDLEGTDAWNHIVNDMLGPVIGIGANIARGIGMASKDPWRGIEAGAPKFIRDGMQAYRVATEGANTLNGDPLIEDMNPLEVLAEVSGFTPARLSRRYDINNRLKNAERRISDRRKAIHREIGDAIREGKPVPKAALKRMREFNREWPEWPITADTIQQSVRGRMRASQRNEFGVSLNPKINERLRHERSPAIYE